MPRAMRQRRYLIWTWGSKVLAAHYFDGLSARAQHAEVTVVGDQLVINLPAGHRVQVPLCAVQWPERTRQGRRMAPLPGGASLQARDVPSWDAWVAEHVKSDSLLVRAQQSWRGVAVAAVLLVTAVAGLYVWGLPLAARGTLALMPLSVDEVIGQQVLTSLEGQMLHPSDLPQADQARIRAAFGQMVQRAYPRNPPAWRLEFRRGSEPKPRPTGNAPPTQQPQSSETARSTLGANAFALPGGTLVLTDELVRLVNDDQVVLGVLGHEMGHVRHRHGMRQLIQVSAIGAMASAVFGDYASLLATLPVLAAGMAYSRDAEREADDEAIAVLRASGISPLVMVKLFTALRADAQRATDSKDARDTSGDLLGIAFSSHPSDTERTQRFEQAAGARPP